MNCKLYPDTNARLRAIEELDSAVGRCQHPDRFATATVKENHSQPSARTGWVAFRTVETIAVNVVLATAACGVVYVTLFGLSALLGFAAGR